MKSTLISAHEISRLLRECGPGQSLVIDPDTGKIYRGKVKTEKLHEIPEKFPGKRRHSMDIGFGDTRWYVGAVLKPWRDSWGNMMKRPVVDKWAELALSLFIFTVVHSPEDGVQELPEKITDVHGHTFRRILVKSTGIIGCFSEKTLDLQWLEINGKIVEV